MPSEKKGRGLCDGLSARVLQLEGVLYCIPGGVGATRYQQAERETSIVGLRKKS